METITLVLLLIILTLGLYAAYVFTEYRIAKRGYKHYISYSPRWKRKAKDCKRRAGNRCQVCNSPTRLEAHHRTYQRLYNEHPSDLTCLCHDCHQLITLHRRLHQPPRNTRPNWRELVGF